MVLPQSTWDFRCVLFGRWTEEIMFLLSVNQLNHVNDLTEWVACSGSINHVHVYCLTYVLSSLRLALQCLIYCVSLNKYNFWNKKNILLIDKAQIYKLHVCLHLFNSCLKTQVLQMELRSDLSKLWRFLSFYRKMKDLSGNMYFHTIPSGM